MRFPLLFALVWLTALPATADLLAQEEAGDAAVVTRIYDVRDLLHRRPDFPAPKLGLGGVEPTPEPEEWEESSWTMDELIEWIERVLEDDLEIAGAQVREFQKKLVISLPARSHERVSNALRGARDRGRAAFTIEAHLWSVPKGELSRWFSKRKSSRRARVLSPEAARTLVAQMAASENAEQIGNPRLGLFAYQRAHFVVMNQEAYVDHFELGGSGEPTEPVVEVLSTGVTLEARVLPRRQRPGVILEWDVQVAYPVPPENTDDNEPELAVPEIVTVSREGRAALQKEELLVIRGLPEPGGDQEEEETILVLKCIATPLPGELPETEAKDATGK